MPKKLPIFYSALLLTAVNLLLRLVGTSFQVYLSGCIGAAGIGLLQLVMSVGSLATVAGIGGIRTATMYLTAEELGRKNPQNVIWVLSGCCLYSIAFSSSVAMLLYRFAPWIASVWIGDPRTVAPLRLFAAFFACHLSLWCHDRLLHGRKPHRHTGCRRSGRAVLLHVADHGRVDAVCGT